MVFQGRNPDKQRKGFFARLKAREQSFIEGRRQKQITRLKEQEASEELGAQQAEEVLGRRQKVEEARTRRLEAITERQKRINELQQREREARSVGIPFLSFPRNLSWYSRI